MHCLDDKSYPAQLNCKRCCQATWAHGSRSSMRLFGCPLMRRVITSARRAWGSTSLSLLVSAREARTVRCWPPPSEPANRAFFCGSARWAGWTARPCWSQARCGHRPGTGSRSASSPPAPERQTAAQSPLRLQRPRSPPRPS